MKYSLVQAERCVSLQVIRETDSRNGEERGGEDGLEAHKETGIEVVKRYIAARI